MKALERVNLCVRQSSKKFITLSEPGTKSYMQVNVNGKTCEKIQVDGCIKEIQPHKCDWAVRGDKGYIFVELKGSDLKHAVKQIKCTVKWFKNNIVGFSKPKRCYIIMSGKILPVHNTGAQILQNTFSKEFNASLDIKRSGFCANY